MSWEWSADLQAQLDQLTAQQRRAILLIVMAESKGEPIKRLLKTPYSCQWCGQVIGQSADGKEARKEALAAHEVACKQNGRPWQFATSLSTYYARWKTPESPFEQCLIQVRREVRENALQRAAWILQMGAPEAALELRRQVGSTAVDDTNRRLSAVAILDRADVGTADKSSSAPVDLAFKRALENAYGKDDDDPDQPHP